MGIQNYVWSTWARSRLLLAMAVITVLLTPWAATDAAEVVEEWVARYNGPSDSSDVAGPIAVSDSGEVHVAGFSTGAGTRTDYATVKYNADGQQLWDVLYNGAANSFDYVAGLVIDNQGHVYVTGASREGGDTAHYSDYLTFEYDAEGNVLWSARYDGPANQSDFARDIALDDDGFVYVTGVSEGLDGLSDYATIKYDHSGSPIWVARFDGAENSYDQAYRLHVDADGNVTVTGTSRGVGVSTDIITIRYNADGIEQWAAQYSAWPGSYNSPSGLAVDGEGTVYVTGRAHDGSDYDYVTIKYDADGVEQWAARFDGTANQDDSASSLAVDASGNVFVTGSSRGIGSIDDYVTIKYDAAGVEQWVARYDGPDSHIDQASRIGLDAYGNVYVTGRSRNLGSPSPYDYATLSYDTDGNQRWAVRYDGPSGGFDAAYGLQVMPDGVLYVTGTSWQDGTDNDFATIKYIQPGLKVEQMIVAVTSLDLESGLEGSLLAKLDSALHAIEDFNDANDGAACNALNAYINAVNAQRGKTIDEEDAQDLVVEAEAVLATLICS